MSLLDFEGNYGRQYNDRIRSLIPGYDAILEIGAATLAARCPQAQTALVVGPGSGQELSGLLWALPRAQLTLVEPSEQMRLLCSAEIERLAAGDRVHWGPEQLQDEPPPAPGRFDAVICHHVLHVLPPAQQRQLLDQLAAQLAPGGVLLVSSYSEPAAPDIEPWRAIATARFRGLGLDEPSVNEVLASRNTKVFPLDPQRLERRLLAAGLEPPTQLLQALCNRLWVSRRPLAGEAGAAPDGAAEAIGRLQAVVAQLRDPEGGCPWDLEQTHNSLLPYLLEEAHEVADAIRQGDARHLAEELGDLLLQVVLHAQIASEDHRFNLCQVATGISDKLVRRHPHVFAGGKAADRAALRQSWDSIKAQERSERQGSTPSTSPLSDQLARKVRGQPALAGAMTISRQAAAAGFEWDDLNGVWAKVHEELDELKEAVALAWSEGGIAAGSPGRAPASGDSAARAHAETELGDVLFTLVNVGRWCRLDPEEGLAGTNRRFLDRFSRLEAALGGDLGGRSLSELEQHWQQAKAAIRAEASQPNIEPI